MFREKFEPFYFLCSETISQNSQTLRADSQSDKDYKNINYIGDCPNVSVNAKPDHPPRQSLQEIF